MADLVIGGIGDPKFCILTDTEYCQNKTFEEGVTTGWTGGGTGALTINNSLPNFYGDYSALIEDDSNGASEYGYYTTPDSLPVGYVLISFEHYAPTTDTSCRVRVGWAANQEQIQTAKSFTAKVGQWNRLSFITQYALGSGGVIVVTILPTATDTVTEVGKVRITNLSIRAISETITMSNFPTTENQSLKQQELYNYFTLSGKRKYSTQGFEYSYEAYYDYLTDTDETNRRKLLTDYDIFLFPHDDKAWGVFCRYNNDFETKWLENKIVGHEGTIQLISTELLEKIQGTFDNL